MDDPLWFKLIEQLGPSIAGFIGLITVTVKQVAKARRESSEEMKLLTTKIDLIGQWFDPDSPVGQAVGTVPQRLSDLEHKTEDQE